MRKAVLIFCVWAGICGFNCRAGTVTRVVAWGAGTNVNTSDYNDWGQSMVPGSLTNSVQVSGGWRHSLALNADGSLTGWGDDSLGQDDFPLTPHVSTNYLVITNSGGMLLTNAIIVSNNVPLTNYISISCGRQHSLALNTEGVVTAAGDDFYGQTDVPAGLTNVVAIAAGFYHSLALKSDGTVAAWGLSTNPISIGNDPNYGQTLVPADLSNVVAIAGGGWHSLALRSDGTLRAWGRADYGQGVVPPGITNAVAIAAGAIHNIALLADGTLTAWGDNMYGQTNIPAGLSNVVAIAAGGWHNLALKQDGTVVAWGAGTNSADASVFYQQNLVPRGLSNVTQIAGGNVHSLALVAGGPPPSKVFVTGTMAGINGFSARIPSRPGKVYRLEYKDFLSDTTWTALPLQAGQFPQLELADPDTTTAQRFYRIRQW